MFANKQKIVADLRDVLASLYEHEASARRIAEDAGLNMGVIAFSSIATDTWYSILNEAEKQGRLIFLIDLNGRYNIRVLMMIGV